MRQGLSPHGRGNRQPGHRDLPRHGSIPARAGKPSSLSLDRNRPWVYPRTGGETFLDVGQVFLIEGLSPHGRGNRGHRILRAQQRGSIPARAGKPFLGDIQGVEAGVYPRTGGETHTTIFLMRTHLGLSPHGRGNHLVQGAAVQGPGSIPARAGKPFLEYVWSCLLKVYPRTGGETACGRASGTYTAGLSPHGRGNR